MRARLLIVLVTLAGLIPLTLSAQTHGNGRAPGSRRRRRFRLRRRELPPPRLRVLVLAPVGRLTHCRRDRQRLRVIRCPCRLPGPFLTRSYSRRHRHRACSHRPRAMSFAQGPGRTLRDTDAGRQYRVATRADTARTTTQVATTAAFRRRRRLRICLKADSRYS